MSSDENFSNAERLSETAIFVNLLKQNKIVFIKDRRTPQMQKPKDQAMESIRLKYNSKTKQNLNMKQIRKKFHNIKNRAKDLIERSKTGQKKKELRDWEKEFLELYEPENKHTDSKTTETLCTPTIDTVMGETYIENPLETIVKRRVSTDSNDENKCTYENLETDELKRVLIISQIRAAAAQEKAALAQERAAVAEEALANFKKSHLLNNALWS